MSFAPIADDGNSTHFTLARFAILSPTPNSLPSPIKSRRAIPDVLLTIALLAFLYCLYFTLYYGWLTATPDAQASNAVQRFYIYLGASGVTLAFVIANIVVLMKRL